MRIVALNDVPGDYGTAVIGPAELSSAPADMLGVTFVTDELPMDQIARLSLECVDPETEAVLFSYVLVNRSARPLPYRTAAPSNGSASAAPMSMPMITPYRTPATPSAIIRKNITTSEIIA